MYAKKNQKEQTFETLLYNFNSKIMPFFENMYLEDITSKDILQWEEHIITLDYSYNYNRNLYYLLSGFLEYCYRFYDFDKKIISRVGCFKRKYEEDKHDFYTLEEFKQFIDCVDEIVYKQFFNFMFYTGVRPGEAMALRFSDIQDDYVRINKNRSNHKNRSIGTPKTLSSNRTIEIDRKLCRDLKELHKYYIQKYGHDEDFIVFGGMKALSPTTINRRKLEACKKANIRPITLHQFRHSHATLLIQKNMMINEVSRRLGHSKTSTTLNIYTHTDSTQEKRVINTLNSLRYNFFETLLYNFKNFISSILKH